MTKDFQGKLFVFSAPSGSGKTTIVRHLLAQERFNLEFSISATSREPRSNEEDGEDYYFISTKEFKNKIKNEEFLEWEEVYIDNFYGTLKTEVERIWAQGKHVIFDIDVVGGLRVKEKFPEQTLAVFVKPPDINELIRRLKKRGEESKEKIAARVAKAPIEFSKAPEFDKIIKNYDLEVALQDAEDLVDEFLGLKSVKKEESK
ncbi:guanylate kinase [Tenacibaculum sp. MAR_2009_124]|uniref:guanylate kinase n=1 Tax=Tenacibaculum sp. MAR_2009_124 TaxID=1250059 RepID=UPI0008980D8F|nr:guanylate kinase [Tenacibaculum sp. MAR_2009_124]SEC17840.1 guanylate kinase [Tenacibaculum sp. MAR_2009_124]